MPTVDESLGVRSQEAGLLKDAVDTLSKNQIIKFEAYIRLILPLDGYAFWVKASSVEEAALANVMGINTTMANQPGSIDQGFFNFEVMGSLHYATELRQDETTNFSLNRAAFTSERHVQQFNHVSPNLIYITEFRGFKFAFSSKGMFYEQMKLWHYEGDGIYPTMATQVIDDPSLINPEKIIVSNSLPLWLSLYLYNPPWPVEITMPRIPLFPSFLAPQNLTPPYGVIHIGPDDTSTDQTIPVFDRTLSSTSLSRDRVRVTLYGLTDNVAQDWLAATLGYLRDAGTMGLCNMPNLRDDKAIQRELFVIAMKKRIDFEVSYTQKRVREVARAYIKKILPATILKGTL